MDLAQAHKEIMENVKNGVVVIGGKQYKIDDIVKGVRDSHQLRTQLQAENADLKKQLEAAKAAPSTPQPGNDPEPTDVEAMDNGQLAEHILGQVKAVINEAVKPIQETVKSVSDGFASNVNQQQIDSVRGEFKDFDEWGDEMREVMEAVGENANMGVRDIYLLARARNPQKVEALAEKANENNGGENKEDAPFGGMFPTSTKGAPVEDMDMDDAAMAAWESEIGPEGEQALAALNG